MSGVKTENQKDPSTTNLLDGVQNGELQATEAETRDADDEEQDPEAGEMQEMTYEEQRLATIRENEQLLKSLGLAVLAPPPPRQSVKASTTSTPTSSGTPTNRVFKKPIKRDLVPTEPLRKSSRISAAAKAKEEEGSKSRNKRKHKRPKLDRNASSLTPLSGSGNQSSGFESDQSSSDTVSSSSTRNRKASYPQVRLPPGERIRIPLRSVEYAAAEGGVEEDYDTVQPIPQRENGDKGRLVFEGRWKGVFVPNLAPEEVFRGGAFGGNYYADAYSNILKQNLSAEDDMAELPPSWLRPASPSPTTSPRIPFSTSTHLTAPARDPSVNRYGVPAGQGLAEWEKSGWIWKGDPRGWMQWYVRFYHGRRCVDDERQVQRWLNLAGPNGRFARALMKKIAQQPGSGGASVENTAVEDEDVGRVMRQVCWQWGLVMDREEWRKRVAGKGGV